MDLPDFDKLAIMAEQHPEKFEALREALIEETIATAQASSQRRLRGLQFQIDMERRKAKTPLAACIRISHLMHESLEELRLHLSEPLNASNLQPDRPSVAKVLSIKAYGADKAGLA